MSANDAYDVIMERLEFPGSTHLRPKLEELIPPDQAQMVVGLPGTLQEVAGKTGIDLNRVKDALDDLFFKGVIFPRGDFRKREFYRFARTIVQFLDATITTEGLDVEKDRRFFELWWDFKMNEMYPYFAERVKERGKPDMRIVPAYKSIKDLDGVLPYENYQELLKAQERIAMQPCPCRLSTTSVGKPCKVHDELAHWVCMHFNRQAEYVVVRGSGKELSLEEALELNDVIEEDGLIHWWPNSSKMTGFKAGLAVCNCCRDCCIFSVPLDQAGLPIGLGWEKSRYQAYVNLDDCNGCQVCVDRCQFDAIEMERPEGSKKYKAVIDPEKCFGCGVCVVGCEPEALKMKVVRPPEHIPETIAPVGA